MSRSIGFNYGTFVNNHVAGEPTYIPAHYKNGKPIQAKCTVPVMQNTKPLGDQAEGRVDSFTVVGWGKLADSLAVSCSKGKALDLMTQAQSYNGNLYNADGTLRLGIDGQPIKIQKTSFNIKDIVYGDDAPKIVQDEIVRGIRPVGWDLDGSPAQAEWKARLKARRAQTWNGGPRHGYARVVVPQGPGIQLAAAPPVGTLPEMVAGVANAFTPPPAQPVYQAQPQAPIHHTPPAAAGTGQYPSLPAGAVGAYPLF